MLKEANKTCNLAFPLHGADWRLLHTYNSHSSFAIVIFFCYCHRTERSELS